MFQSQSVISKGIVAILCCAGLSACSVNSATYGTGQSVGGGAAKDFANIATFGLVDGADKKEKIVYQERSALVIPSKEQFSQIPRPQEKTDKGNSIAANNEALERIEKAETQVAAASGQAQADAQLPFKPKKKSLFSRLGVSRVSDTARAGKGDLTEVPPEYRIPQDVPGASNTDPFAKKKKKKRFLLF